MKFGCNYWASHAGTEMWRNWDETIVKEDMRKLKEAGNEILRPFPLWRDFQPIELLRGAGSTPKEVTVHGKPLPLDPIGQAGCDVEMFRRFRILCDAAYENGMKLIVPMITGWMSGRLFVPPAIENRNIFTDPFALKWQVKFVRAFVREFKDHPAIIMWELGNECNCLYPVSDPDVPYNWTNMIISAIKTEDMSRPSGSGMHGLKGCNVDEFDKEALWTIQVQGEICDFLTPHPYPQSISKAPARTDCHTSIRSLFQPAIETQLYSDLGKRPAFVEEINTFGSGYCSEKIKALFMRNSMFNAWAHGSEYFLWWCAFEQDNLPFPPYTWCVWERELGEYDGSGNLRLAAKYCADLTRMYHTLPFRHLSKNRRDAVCILTRGMGYTPFLNASWTSFLMAKMAGFDISFEFIHYDIPESDCYIMPCVRNLCGCFSTEFNAILEKVANGATLFMSVDEEGIPTGVEKTFGCEFMTREKRIAPAKFSFNGQDFQILATMKFFIHPLDCEVLASEEDGNPVFIRKQYGKGEIYFLALPLEDYLGSLPRAFSGNGTDWISFYRIFSRKIVAARKVRSVNNMVTLTEHTDEYGKNWVIAVNNSDMDQPTVFDFSSGRSPAQPLPEKIEAHNGIIFELKE